MKVTKGRGYVYSIQYHVVWCVKYRRKVLVGDVEKRLKEMLYHIADVNDFSIVTMETDQDHIHLLIDCSPQHYIPNIIKAIKGNTARFLFKEFPYLKNKLWDGHLWNSSYFIATVSENTRKQVLEYIESQKSAKQEVKGKCTKRISFEYTLTKNNRLLLTNPLDVVALCSITS